jgi:hypothetical protein
LASQICQTEIAMITFIDRDRQWLKSKVGTTASSVFAMNYIKQLQADKAEALDCARSVEAAINHLISYLSCLSFTSIRGYR